MKKTGDIKIKSVNFQDGNHCRLVYCIEKDSTEFELYYEVDSEYGKYFCYDIADGVVVSILSFAMRGGYYLKEWPYELGK